MIFRGTTLILRSSAKLLGAITGVSRPCLLIVQRGNSQVTFRIICERASSR